MSLARGSYIKKTDYYKAFEKTNYENNKGELNYFIDQFLQILITGQEDILENLKQKIEKLEFAYNLIETKIKKADTKLKKSILYILFQSYYFDSNSGISRDIIIEHCKENHFTNTIIRELKILENEKLIEKVKKRPIIYTIDKNLVKK